MTVKGQERVLFLLRLGLLQRSLQLCIRGAPLLSMIRIGTGNLQVHRTDSHHGNDGQLRQDENEVRTDCAVAMLLFPAGSLCCNSGAWPQAGAWQRAPKGRTDGRTDGLGRFGALVALLRMAMHDFCIASNLC